MEDKNKATSCPLLPSRYATAGNIMASHKNLSGNQPMSPTALLECISRIESTTRTTSMKLQYMTCLIPEESIPVEAFIRMTCLLCNSKVDLELKVEILKWMNTVYSFVDDLSTFLDLIEIFFQLLECKTLQPFVSMLLLKTTKPEHITLKRINNIARLLNQVEPGPFLLPLMSSYCKIAGVAYEPKNDTKFMFDSCGIYPSLIQKFHPLFETPILEHYIVNDDDESQPIPPFAIKIEKPTQLSPVVQHENNKSSSTHSHEENEFLMLYKEFESFEKQKVLNILENKYRRVYLTSDISQIKRNSIEDYILCSAYSDLKNMDSLPNLHNTVKIFHEMQRSVPNLSDVTQKIIEQWDGTTGLDIILEMLSYEPVCCFEKFQYKLEMILEKLLNSSVLAKCDLLNGLSNLYRQWVIRELKQNSHVTCESCDCSFSDVSTVSEDQSITKRIRKLSSYIIEICDTFLLDNSNICLQKEILLLLERVSRCHMEVTNLVMCPPSTIIFHTALFSRHSLVLESLCRLMIRYKDEIEEMRKNKNPEYRLAAIYFKRYKNDILLLLLKGGYQSNIITHLSKENVISRLTSKCPNFEKSFDVYRHPALVPKLASFVKTCQISLSHSEIKNNPEIRNNYFKYLKENGHEYLVMFLDYLMSN